MDLFVYVAGVGGGECTQALMDMCPVGEEGTNLHALLWELKQKKDYLRILFSYGPESLREESMKIWN